MDGRYHRSTGVENALPALHHRHKSTGNLSNMPSNASTAGMRGPAKRAAFEDVTNMAQHNNAVVRDGNKVHKVQSAWHLNARSQTTHGKENVALGKDVLPLARPARKIPSLTAKASSRDIRSVEQEKKAGKVVEQAQSMPVQGLTKSKQHQPVEDSTDRKVSNEATLAVPPLQPRHYKSQPQLKQQTQGQDQQPALRRTQSRQLERASFYDEPIVKLSSDPTISDILPSSSLASDPPVIPDVIDSQYESVIEDVIYEEAQDEVAARLPEISEEPAHAAVDFEENQQPVLSEPEEYWEAEDDEYDDQGYMTAHSFKSRDMTGGITGNATVVVQPRVTARDRRELDEGRMVVAATRLQEDVEEEYWDISMVAEYSDDIFDYLQELENKMLPDPDYMSSQTEIQWSMRSVLMEWIVQVHGRFQLLPETLFLTVNYIDRFLTAKVVSINKLQLVGATAILVASKYEEINCPSLQEIVYMVDGGFSAEEILKAERFMLSMLGFELGWPGPMSFLRRVSKADDYDLDTRTLAKYFLELTIMDERFVASQPSFLAAGAHCLSRLILNKGYWTPHHVHYSGYTWSQLKPLVTMMIECCEKPEEHHQAIFDKYAEKKFKEASIMVQRTLDAGFALPHQKRPIRSSAQPIYFEDAAEHFHHHLLPVHA